MKVDSRVKTQRRDHLNTSLGAHRCIKPLVVDFEEISSNTKINFMHVYKASL
jgi:hypothetical protein